jgi:type II secretory pathway component PulK
MRRSFPRERGSVLVIVLWICFGLVALVLYFAQSASADLRTSANRGALLAAREAVEGGGRYVRLVLSRSAANGSRPLSADYEARAVPVGEARFWIVGRDADLAATAEPAFGLVDETAKINLNTAPRRMLEALPGMTPELAGAILDWRDGNSTVTESGAEDETYSRLTPPRLTKNGPFETLDELRLVSGATLDILFGEDWNRNGALDPNEDDGDASPPLDNRDGVLQRGLFDYLTVYSVRANTRADGTRRYDVASPAARGRLAGLLNERFGEARAAAILSGLGGQTLGSVAEFLVRGRLTPDEFRRVESDLTATSGGSQRGLINVNTAPEAVLACIPGIGTERAPAIVAYRLSRPESLDSIAWLAEVLSPGEFLQAGPFITGESYQYSADICAVGPLGRGYARSRFVFDTRRTEVRVLHRQDLAGFGWAPGDAERDALLSNEPLFAGLRSAR